MYQCRTDGKTIHKKKETQMTHGWTDALERYLDHNAKIDISHIATAEQRGRYKNLLHIRAFGEDLNGPPSASRFGYQEPNNVLKGMQEQWRKDVGIGFIPTSARKRLNEQLHPDTKGFLQWPKCEMVWIFRTRKANFNRSANRPLSSTWSQSSSWWNSPSWTPNWDTWYQRNLQDDKSADIRKNWDKIDLGCRSQFEHQQTGRSDFARMSKIVEIYRKVRMKEVKPEVIDEANWVLNSTRAPGKWAQWLRQEHQGSRKGVLTIILSFFVNFFCWVRVQSDATHWTRRVGVHRHLTGRAGTHFSCTHHVSLAHFAWLKCDKKSQRLCLSQKKNWLHFSICACHPCAGAMLRPLRFVLTVLMAESLVAELHGRLLRRVSSKRHYQGLGVAARDPFAVQCASWQGGKTATAPRHGTLCLSAHHVGLREFAVWWGWRVLQ